MSDSATRALERDQGESLEAEVALLQRRVREGTLTTKQVELLAYVGNEGAREIQDDPAEFRWCSGGCGSTDAEAGCMHLAEDLLDAGETPPPSHWVGKTYCGCCGQGWNPDYEVQEWDGRPRFDAWLRGLGRWPGVLLRAAVAAAEATVPSSCCGGGHPSCQRDCLSELVSISAIKLWIGGDSSGVDLLMHPGAGPLDLCYHLRNVAWDLRTGGSKPQDLASQRLACKAAARLAGEQRTRAAICAALQAWALEGVL